MLVMRTAVTDGIMVRVVHDSQAIFDYVWLMLLGFAERPVL